MNTVSLAIAILVGVAIVVVVFTGKLKREQNAPVKPSKGKKTVTTANVKPAPKKPRKKKVQ